MAMPPDSWAGLAVSAPERRTRARVAAALSWAWLLGRPANTRGRATLSRTLAQGIRVADWNTTAVSPRAVVRDTRPAVGSSSAASRRRAVLLPQPDGPTRATISPGSRLRENGPSARPRPG